MLLEKGQRGLIVGQTGSGKSQNALFQLRNSRVWPVVIFDTKIEDEFLGLPDAGDTLELTNNFGEFKELSKRRRDERPTFTVVRPALDELTDFEALDAYTRLAYDKFGSGMFYFDEIYNWHNRGQAGNGLIGLLTRGRSKGKTVLMATQRPSWISRFCLTEAQKFYIHWLIDQRDKKTLAEVIPGFEYLPDLPLHHFYFYTTLDHRAGAKAFKPVPLFRPDPEVVRKIGWI